MPTPIRLLALPAVALTLLTSCATEPEEAQNAPSELVRPAEAEVFVPANAEALQLGTVDYIFSLTIEQIEKSRDLPGSSIAEVSIDSIEWQANERWRAGERVGVPTLRTGAVSTVLIDDAWILERGDAVIAAMSAEQISDKTIGYVQVVLNSDSTVRAAVPGTKSGAISDFVRFAADDRKSAGNALPILEELILDARVWLDVVNTATDEAGAEAVPGGIYDELRPDPTANVGPLEVFMKTDPALRQMPQRLDEIPGLAESLDARLEVGSFAIFTPDETHSYFALRFPGVGVVGPWNNTPEYGYGRLFGVSPMEGEAEVLVWTQDDPQPGSERSLGTFAIPAEWNPGEDILVMDLADGDKAAFATIPIPEFARQVEEILKRVGPLEEPKAEEAELEQE